MISVCLAGMTGLGVLMVCHDNNISSRFSVNKTLVSPFISEIRIKNNIVINVIIAKQFEMIYIILAVVNTMIPRSPIPANIIPSFIKVFARNQALLSPSNILSEPLKDALV